MLNTDGQYRLVFATNTQVTLETLVQGLTSLGFIGDKLFEQQPTNEFCAGDTFLSSITFMGCSPYIEFEPPENLSPNDKADFCFIRFSTSDKQNVIYHTGQLRQLKTIPRCQQCRKLISDWTLHSQKLEQAEPFPCPHCKTILNVENIDWRKASGIGNVFIEVLNVYLQEAVPTDAFIQQLENITSSSWQYFYTDSNYK